MASVAVRSGFVVHRFMPRLWQCSVNVKSCSTDTTNKNALTHTGQVCVLNFVLYTILWAIIRYIFARFCFRLRRASFRLPYGAAITFFSSEPHHVMNILTLQYICSKPDCWVLRIYITREAIWKCNGGCVCLFILRYNNIVCSENTIKQRYSCYAHYVKKYQRLPMKT